MSWVPTKWTNLIAKKKKTLEEKSTHFPSIRRENQKGVLQTEERSQNMQEKKYSEMDREIPNQVSGKSSTGVVSSVDEIGDGIECSCRYCGSCTATMIADCVAICCCPCAVLNFLAFAFVKVPWIVGKRFLRLGKKNKSKNRRKLCRKIIEEYEDE